ncbi:MAG: hypothetical protein H5U40_02580, partial [Polyangiaceae bacterium]|nr:hypothetical protein [Polyangiaceae bacterium]
MRRAAALLTLALLLAAGAAAQQPPSTRSTPASEVRATSGALGGRGYIAAVVARPHDGGALLYAARADRLDVFSL